MTRLAAMDFAWNSCGLVISDQHGGRVEYEYLLEPKKILKFKKTLKHIFARHPIDMLFIGLPLGSYGQTTNQSKMVKSSIHSFRECLPKYQYIDEHNSTKEAHKILQYNLIKKQVDILAARIILFKGINLHNNP